MWSAEKNLYYVDDTNILTNTCGIRNALNATICHWLWKTRISGKRMRSWTTRKATIIWNCVSIDWMEQQRDDTDWRPIRASSVRFFTFPFDRQRTHRRTNAIIIIIQLDAVWMELTIIFIQYKFKNRLQPHNWLCSALNSHWIEIDVQLGNEVHTTRNAESHLMLADSICEQFRNCFIGEDFHDALNYYKREKLLDAIFSSSLSLSLRRKNQFDAKNISAFQLQTNRSAPLSNVIIINCTSD